MPYAPRRLTHLLAAGAMLATSACRDEPTPTAPVPGNLTAVAAMGGNTMVKIRKTQLSANTLRIDGPSFTASITIANSDQAFQSGISLRAEIAQPAAVRQAAALPTKCLPGDPAGFLPSGNCDMTFTANVSNSAPGGGTLVAGLAVFRLTVLQTVGGVATELASKTVEVNLVATPAITSLALTSTTLAIDGPGTTYTVTMNNPASSLQGVLIQGYMVQGATRRAAGGASLTCGGSVGVMTPGVCTMTFGTSAANQNGGSGTLVPGPATFELNLIQNTGTEVLFDTKTVAVTLVSSTPSITSISLLSPSFRIDGPSVGYTVQIQNPGFPLTGVVFLQGEIVQTTGAGTAVRGAGGFSVTCGADVGVLPTTGQGVCTMQLTATASNSAGGTGTLVPGLAHFKLTLSRFAGGVTTQFDVESVEVSLTLNSPTITSVNLSSSYLVLGAGFTSYTASFDNPGALISDVVVQTWISQGATTRRALGGRVVNCNGGPDGDLPTGACTVPSDIVAFNSGSGTGTLVLGPATLEVELKQGSTGTIFDTKTFPVTLVATTPSIVSIVLSSTSIPLPGSRSYDVTVYNPTSTTLTPIVFVQGYLEQAGGTSYGAGGTNVQCNATANLPPGACTFSFTVNAVNNGAGTGLLVPGPATFRLDLMQNATVLDSKSVAVTLTSP